MTKVVGYRKPQHGSEPPFLYPAYRSTQSRAPSQPAVEIPPTLSEVTGPRFSPDNVSEVGTDLTIGGKGEPIGERILIVGQVRDEDGRPVPKTLVEIWQCNAAGRYRHARDQHDAPLDPNFEGCARFFTDRDGRYGFKSIRPGAYPWGNHHNAFRPAHIHFSLFGPAWSTRLITQMYFPGDPLLAHDPIFQAIPEQAARERLVSILDLEHSQSGHALCYKFDIILRGRGGTPLERQPRESHDE